MLYRRLRMHRRWVAVAVAAALSLVACDSTTPTASPAARTLAPSSSAPPSADESAAPSAGLQIDDPPYLAGDAFMLPVDFEGADWLAPTSPPIMPNGQAAVRVAFLPTSCVTGDFRIQAGIAWPQDPWQIALDEAVSEHSSFGSAPAPQFPECEEGRGPTYLEVGYYPLPLGTIRLAATPRNDITDVPTEVEVVPVYTSTDATQPTLTMPGVIGLEPRSGRTKPRKASPQEVVSTTFQRATLPDGSAPDQWGFRVTGCESSGPSFVDVTVRIGSEEPVPVGQCSEGTYSTAEFSLPLPAEGTPFAVLMAGGTTKSYVQVAEFQWRGDRN